MLTARAQSSSLPPMKLDHITAVPSAVILATKASLWLPLTVWKAPGVPKPTDWVSPTTTTSSAWFVSTPQARSMSRSPRKLDQSRLSPLGLRRITNASEPAPLKGWKLPGVVGKFQLWVSPTMTGERSMISPVWPPGWPPTRARPFGWSFHSPPKYVDQSKVEPSGDSLKAMPSWRVSAIVSKAPAVVGKSEPMVMPVA